MIFWNRLKTFFRKLLGMFAKQNKFQLAYKAQYLPIVWVIFGLVMLQFALHHFQYHEKLTLIAFSCINIYLYPQDRISGPWFDGKWHCLQLAEDGSHCHCLEPDCREGRHVLKCLLNIQLPPVSNEIICQWCLGEDDKEMEGYACCLFLSCFLTAFWWAHVTRCSCGLF